MKRLILILTLSFISIGVNAQSNCVAFKAKAPISDELTEADKEALKLKVQQILTRNNVSTTTLYDAFEVVPTLITEPAVQLVGGIKEVAVIEGELTLEAINSIDGSVYNSVTIEVEGNGSSRDRAISSLIKSIRPNNPLFVKFVKTSVERITDYYTDNIQVIITKIETLLAEGKKEEALKFARTVPECVPAYSQVADMISHIVANDDDHCCPLKDSTTTTTTTTPTDKEPILTKSIKVDNVEVSVVSCSGSLSSNEVVIKVLVKNIGEVSTEARFATVTKIYTDKNETYSSKDYSGGTEIPSGISVQKSFEFQKVPASNKSCTVLFKVRGNDGNYKDVKFENVEITWN